MAELDFFVLARGVRSGLTVSRVAVFKRLRRGGLEAKRRAAGGALGSFGRVIVQDSAILALPGALFDAVPGSVNQHGSTASMRGQAFLDLKSELFLRFGIASYRRNGQKASADVLEIAREGDLVVRDLGYYSLEVVSALLALKASVLTRLRKGSVLTDPRTGERIDLLARLRSSSRLDMRVKVGEKAAPR